MKYKIPVFTCRVIICAHVCDWNLSVSNMYLQIDKSL